MKKIVFSKFQLFARIFTHSNQTVPFLMKNVCLFIKKVIFKETYWQKYNLLTNFFLKERHKRQKFTW